ncbi:hypothetical protein CB1_001358005 [Camelus ferus]|nr:hypothetical protein CB1_001358005 [Camelus ferus]
MKFTACSDWFTVLGPRNCGISSHREAAIRHRSPLRTFDLVDREIQVVFLRDQTNPSTMNRGSSFVKNSCDDTQKLEKKSKAFKDISKYFSKEEWANLAYSQKITYVYMKRNYETMTGLGPKIERVKVWANRLRERKHRVIYEEISDPEEDD